MKKSASRISKRSSNSLSEKSDKNFHDIPDVKWDQIKEEEEKDNFILSLRDEIISQALELIFESYMEKQAVFFTTHCAYFAWQKVIGVYDMHRDGCQDAFGTWEADSEPPPSQPDSWISHVIKADDLRPTSAKEVSPEVPSEKTQPSSLHEEFEDEFVGESLFGEYIPSRLCPKLTTKKPPRCTCKIASTSSCAEARLTC